MKKRHITATIILCLIVIGGVIGFSACASVASAQPKSGLEAQVSTAVAATLVQYMIETEVAAQSLALVEQPADQAQATETPVPTPTLLPTQSAPPTAQPTATAQAAQPTATAPPAAPASGPQIIADQDTNCRVGPGTGYTVDTYFREGSESTVEGRDAGKDWWYIVHPDDSGEHCWVWDGSTTVVGDTSTVPVVDAPAAANPKTSNFYSGCYSYNPYVYHPYGCGNYYPNTCGKKSNWKTVNWWTCNPYVTCTCKTVFQNPCKQWRCPPVTQVNFENYCDNYPKCCD